MYTHVYSRTIGNSQKGGNNSSVYWERKRKISYTYNGRLFSHFYKRQIRATTWMGLKHITVSERRRRGRQRMRWLDGITDSMDEFE